MVEKANSMSPMPTTQAPAGPSVLLKAYAVSAPPVTPSARVR